MHTSRTWVRFEPQFFLASLYIVYNAKRFGYSFFIYHLALRILFQLLRESLNSLRAIVSGSWNCGMLRVFRLKNCLALFMLWADSDFVFPGFFQFLSGAKFSGVSRNGPTLRDSKCHLRRLFKNLARLPVMWHFVNSSDVALGYPNVTFD